MNDFWQVLLSFVFLHIDIINVTTENKHKNKMPNILQYADCNNKGKK